MTIGAAGSSVDHLDFQFVELSGQSRDFGALGGVRLTAVAFDRTVGTVIALVRKPNLIMPTPAGEFGWSFDTREGALRIEEPKFRERGLDDLLVERAHLLARDVPWIPEPKQHPARTAAAAEMMSPLLEVHGEALDLGDGSRLSLVAVAADRAGAVVVALLTSPERSIPATVGYLAWALSGERRVQTVVRHGDQAGKGIGTAMWEFACRGSELVDWIGHPQHQAERTDAGEAFVSACRLTRGGRW